MRIQCLAKKILQVAFFFSLSAFASPEKEVKTLFENYDEVMSRQKIELIDEVFTQEFLKEHGGKEEFVTKVKTLPYLKKKKGLGIMLQKLKASKVGKFFSIKAKSGAAHSSEFILKKENGKLKINGTVSDG